MLDFIWSQDNKRIIEATKEFKEKGEVLVIPEGIEEILPFAFEQCNKLKRVVLPDTLKRIGIGAFSNCEFLEEISKIPDGVKIIEPKTFFRCLRLKNINLNKVTSVKDAAFQKTNLSEFELGGVVESISVDAFAETKIRNLHIPKTVRNIEIGAFDRLHDLITITVDKNNKYFDSREGCNCLIRTELNELINFASERSFIPPSVTSISDCAFSNNNISEIIIPEGVTSLNGECFFEAGNLKKILLPSTLNYMFHYLFDTIPPETKILYAGSRKNFLKIPNAKGFYYKYKGNIEFLDSVEKIIEAGYSLKQVNSILNDSER